MSVLISTRKLSLAGLVTFGLACAGLLGSSAQSFAASAPSFGEPLAPSAITRTTATVEAQVNPQESQTTYEVRYGVDASLGRHTPEAEAGSGSTLVTVNAGLSGLTPGTTYRYEFVAKNAEGVTVGPEGTFTTEPPTPPTATTDGASGIALTSAPVSGTGGADGLATSYELDLGTDTTYGTSMYGEAGSSPEAVAISVQLTGLAPGTTYHYRIDAVNSDGRAYGADRAFTTPAYDKPIVMPPTAPLLVTPSTAFPAEASGKTGPLKKKVKHKRKARRRGAHRRSTKARNKKKR